MHIDTCSYGSAAVYIAKVSDNLKQFVKFHQEKKHVTLKCQGKLFYNIVENDEPSKSFKSESHSPYKDELNKISL